MPRHERPPLTDRSRAVRLREDRVAIERLRVAGIDLDRPRNVAHVLWLPDESWSRLVAEAVHKPGRTVVTGPGSPASGCPVVVFVEHELTLDVIGSLRAEFQAIVEGLGGAYQGWSLPGHKGTSTEGDR